MDAPPPYEDPRPFVAVAEWLASVGLSAPEILARDLQKGLLLLADFGDWRVRGKLPSQPPRPGGQYCPAPPPPPSPPPPPPLPGPPRRAGPPRNRAGDDRPLCRRDRRRGGIRARLLGARGAAQHAHPRCLHAPVEARQQAALSPLPAADVGPPGARPCPAWPRAGARLVRRQRRTSIPPRSLARDGMSQARKALRLRAEVPGEVPHTAMIIAAGLGKRMRPLTATRPKPLIEVGGKALLDHVLERLRVAGVKKGRGNGPYLADALEAHLASRAHGLEVVISDERNLLLETGGGLVQAAPLIDSDPFLALNSDNLWVDGPADTL